MHGEVEKKRWVYANKECTLNTAITVDVMRTEEIVIIFVNMACVCVTILQFNSVRYAAKI